MVPSSEGGSHDKHEPARQLVRQALDEIGELVRVEVALARNEMKQELLQARAAVLALSVAAATAIASIAVFMVAIALAFSVNWLAAFVVAVVLLLAAAGLGLAGYKLLPTKPMAETARRIESELNQLKERIQ